MIAQNERGSVSIRVLTYNVGLLSVSLLGKKFFEPAPYVKERLKRLPDALLSLMPDVVALQEIYDRKQKDWLTQSLTKSLPYFIQGRSAIGPWLGDGLMLFSRYKISRSKLITFAARPHLTERLFSSKGFLVAEVHLDTDLSLIIANTHTTAGGVGQHPEWPQVEAARQKQMSQLCGFLDKEFRSHAQIIVGDLNAGPEASPRDYRLLLDRGFVDANVVANGGAAGITWDPANPLNDSGPHNMCPKQRIDHVLIRGDIDTAEAQVVLSEPLVSAGNKHVTISDHYGVMARVTVHREAPIVARADSLSARAAGGS